MDINFPTVILVRALLFKIYEKNTTNFVVLRSKTRNWKSLNSLSANPEKWSNTLKQIVGNLPTICLSVFHHFMNLALKALKVARTKLCSKNVYILYILHIRVEKHFNLQSVKFITFLSFFPYKARILAYFTSCKI